jgi:uncharacterized RDD family membrane protein YckC
MNKQFRKDTANSQSYLSNSLTKEDLIKVLKNDSIAVIGANLPEFKNFENTFFLKRLYAKLVDFAFILSLISINYLVYNFHFHIFNFILFWSFCIIIYLYFINSYYNKFQATLGKRLFNLKVQGTQKIKLTLKQILIRESLYLGFYFTLYFSLIISDYRIIFILNLISIFGIIFDFSVYLFSKNKISWHDQVAQTKVIDRQI